MRLIPLPLLRLALAGLAATLVGVGLARFAYAPLITPMVEQGWFSATQTAWLGAANLLGYLVGALAGAPLARRFGGGRVIRLNLILTTAALAACLWPAPFAWFAFWRGLAGASGAILMVVAVSEALGRTPARHRPAVGAVMFSGIGIGVAFSGMVVPGMAGAHAAMGWATLAGAALLATVLSLRTWSRPARTNGGDEAPKPRWQPRRYSDRTAVLLLAAGYCLVAVGYIPHTVFWVDYLAREVGLGLDRASAYWTLFGLGALIGALLAGAAARRFGFAPALAATLGLMGLATLLPSVWPFGPVLFGSSLFMGATTPGMVVLVSGRLSELCPPGHQARLWGRLTAAFALTQAAAAWAHSMLFTWSGSYRPLLWLGGAALLVAAGLAVRAAWPHRRRTAAR
ncbi:YbfB/YjiJ family MFS transporter [Alkalilimnicola ehrlichii MLHE-1]|uniref:Major facilitator superfamily MFS_1 n=1 Tax=Alkalilimnicola ehrlichii (strain ATCC BAA-1101 / DSM 17681 / MLHE-1) TaxID=187272 RepID=Q0A9C5_ALKEH|nr:YbfB/YjiJ family MFS transporter [Alkalilimnicola ehrlichii]ABI56562.1 major facilitator superfamily MFS_1 [Alkalilimnicola ehrlichii MLHE-1]